ncbi:unnamed protein product, partial [Dibothriocephalus latus]
MRPRASLTYLTGSRCDEEPASGDGTWRVGIELCAETIRLPAPPAESKSGAGGGTGGFETPLT